MTRYTTLMAAALVATPAAACEVKLVFNRWCLGAEAEAQLKDAKIKTDRMHAGRRFLFVEDEGHPGTILLALTDGRLASVTREYKPGAALQFRDLRSRLVGIYGAGEDRSRFPGYATDWDSRETAIALKRGRAVTVWRQDKFTIILSWADADAVKLNYYHTDLANKAAKDRPSDL